MKIPKTAIKEIKKYLEEKKINKIKDNKSKKT